MIQTGTTKLTSRGIIGPAIWFIIPAALFFALTSASSAATILFSHSGLTNPTTEGWTTGGLSTGQAITSGSIEAWQVYDPATQSAARTYNQTFAGAQLSEALTLGWQLSAKIEYVQPAAVATSMNNNAWCTVLINEGVVNGTTERRTLYGLYFGNDASGNTLVGLYPSGTGYTVSAGFHDYYLAYDPLLGTAALYIDGVLKTTTYNGTEIDNASTSRLYWGDNTTTTPTLPIGANYAYVGFSVGAVPEPSKAALAFIALMTFAFHRRR